MKKYFRNFCAALGGCLIGFWARSLDTAIGCLFFTLGILLLVGSLISESKSKKKRKKKRKFSKPFLFSRINNRPASMMAGLFAFLSSCDFP